MENLFDESSGPNYSVQEIHGVDVDREKGQKYNPDSGNIEEGGLDTNMTLDQVIENAKKTNEMLLQKGERGVNIIVKSGPRAMWSLKYCEPSEINENIKGQKYNKKGEKYRDLRTYTMWIITWKNPSAEMKDSEDGEVANIESERKNSETDSLRSVKILKCLREDKKYHERIQKDIDEILVDCCLAMDTQERKQQLVYLVSNISFEDKCDILREYLVSTEVSLSGREEAHRNLYECFKRVTE